MEPVIDRNKEYGIVLEGGGAKGAYQIGVWKALKEAGLKISAIAGASVGALNGALICMDDIEKAETVWGDISYSKVMDVDDDIMEKLIKRELPIKEAIKESIKFLGDGGVDITPLKNLITEHIEEETIRKSLIQFYVVTFSLTELKELDLDAKEIPEGLLGDLLLASACFPGFKKGKIHGSTYLDGGMLNNVPIESLIKRGYKNIIIIRIFGAGLEKRVKIPEDVNVTQIEPRVDLGNMFEFDKKKSARNINIGYYDGLRAIYNLKGKIYYIEEIREECYYLNQFLSLKDEIKVQLAGMYKLETKKDLLNRNIFEIILPAIASELKLSKEWSYSELYIAMLEASAKLYRMKKYKIYTSDTLLSEIKKKDMYLKKQAVNAMTVMDWGEEFLPAFAVIILSINIEDI